MLDYIQKLESGVPILSARGPADAPGGAAAAGGQRMLGGPAGGMGGGPGGQYGGGGGGHGSGLILMCCRISRGNLRDGILGHHHWYHHYELVCACTNHVIVVCVCIDGVWNDEDRSVVTNYSVSTT